jgi:hypothetical protein
MSEPKFKNGDKVYFFDAELNAKHFKIGAIIPDDGGFMYYDIAGVCAVYEFELFAEGYSLVLARIQKIKKQIDLLKNSLAQKEKLLKTLEHLQEYMDDKKNIDE